MYYVFYKYGSARGGDYHAGLDEFDTELQARNRILELQHEHGYNGLVVTLIEGKDIT